MYTSYRPLSLPELDACLAAHRGPKLCLSLASVPLPGVGAQMLLQQALPIVWAAFTYSPLHLHKASPHGGLQGMLR